MAKDFEQVKQAFDKVVFNETFDMIVAVANGGIIPAAMINQRMGIEFQLLKLSLRDSSQRQIYPEPQLVEPIHFDPRGKRILLVEDRIKTGQTIEVARRMLLGEGAALVRTFAVNGNADYAVYNETCFRFPWIM